MRRSEISMFSSRLAGRVSTTPQPRRTDLTSPSASGRAGSDRPPAPIIANHTEASKSHTSVPNRSSAADPSAARAAHRAARAAQIGALLAAATVAGATLLPGLPALAQPLLTPDERNSIKVFRDNTPGVVYITNLALRQDIFTPNLTEVPQGAGSGVIINKQGDIITNYHVVKDSKAIAVTIGTGKDSIEYTKIQVLGFDPDKDLAVLKVLPDEKHPLRPELFRPIKYGTSSDLVVGQKVYAIGHPFGLQHTLTAGIISGLAREIPSGINGKPIEDVIQTDASINPGNSGGPLLDTSGELIGLNTAIFSPSGGSAGVGFAIPVDTIKPSVEQILEFGKVIRPFLGISFAPDSSVSELGINGVLVLDTKEGGPAFKAGIKGTTRDDYGRLVLGDIIVSMNSQPVKNSGDLYRVLGKTKVGQSVDLELLREKSKEHVQVILESRDS